VSRPQIPPAQDPFPEITFEFEIEDEITTVAPRFDVNDTVKMPIPELLLLLEKSRQTL
jgi:hypothetical protein